MASNLLYYKSKNLVITPIDFGTQDYYGGNFNLNGFQDINGDGTLDIIIGDPVGLILESYQTGFRSWGFPFFPSGGC